MQELSMQLQPTYYICTRITYIPRRAWMIPVPGATSVASGSWLQGHQSTCNLPYKAKNMSTNLNGWLIPKTRHSKFSKSWKDLLFVMIWMNN
ncbi:hypothetical protein Sjap_010859 [Stephania japonica]|uniref:Uncharacterized protein n=1 Tax=Stephania japonica TaxID=461633 RepID=A0AAP0P441_9MAGN